MIAFYGRGLRSLQRDANSPVISKNSRAQWLGHAQDHPQNHRLPNAIARIVKTGDAEPRLSRWSGPLVVEVVFCLSRIGAISGGSRQQT